MIFLLLLVPLIGFHRQNAVSAELDLLLLHTNDMHSRFDQADVYGNLCSDNLAKANKCYGGFARVKKAVQDLRNEATKQGLASLFLNAGDTFQGTPYFNVFKWKIVAEMISLLGIDAMSLGNHEFDDGVKDLTTYLQHITIPVLASNLNLTLEPSLQLPILKRSIVLEVNGHKVGIIGYLTPDTKEISNAGDVIFLDEIESIRAEAKTMKSNGVNIIIALGHSGFYRDIEIAQNVPEVSLIVGGHTHSLLYTPKENPPSIDSPISDYPFIVQQPSGRKVPIVQAYCNTKYLGKLRVKFNDNGDAVEATGNTILLDASYAEDDYVLQKLSSYKQGIQKLISVVVGKTNVLLSKTVNLKENAESNFGNLIADAFVNYEVVRYNGKNGWTDTAIAMYQSGGVRTNIDNLKNSGQISYGDLLTALPFDDKLVKVEISGKTLRKALEHSMSNLVTIGQFTYVKNFLYTSGLRIVYDLSRPAGSRIKTILIKCTNCMIPKYQYFCPHHNHTIVTTSYLLQGGDGFTMIKNEHLQYEPIAITAANAVSNYISVQRVVYPGLDGRVTVENIESVSLGVRRSGFSVTLIVCSLLYWSSSIYS